MKICFTSYRPFADGPVKQPFLESDPVNIAYALSGSYLSFYTLKNLSDRQLAEKLQPYDLIIVALDVEAINLVWRIVQSRPGRVMTYSEGHVADYQHLSPIQQVTFLKIIRAALINFLYWEKYIPFYRALTDSPVEYLPYPYLLDETRRYFVPLEHRPSRTTLPAGLAGSTRNGLATLAVAKRLLKMGLIDEVMCWLSPYTVEADAQAVSYFFFSKPVTDQSRLNWFNWRWWLLSSRIDYRLLLKLKSKLRSASAQSPTTDLKVDRVTLCRRGNWAPYLAQLATARILIDLNNRETVGRNALDCAALGVPCVSTDRSDMQPRLFPATTLNDSWDIDGAVELCRRLLIDSAFYRQTVDYAATAIQEFDVEPFKHRFDQIADRYQLLAANL